MLLVRHTMDNVVKAKNVDISRIETASPRAIINGKSYNFTLLYNEYESLTMQLPRCQLYTGLYESDGKCYCELLLPSDGITSDLYYRIAAKLEKLVKEKRVDLVDVTFVGHLRRMSTGSNLLRLKLPQNKSSIQTEVVSREGNKLSFAQFTKGATVIPIVALDNVYVINKTLGFNLLLKQVVVLE